MIIASSNGSPIGRGASTVSPPAPDGSPDINDLPHAAQAQTDVGAGPTHMADGQAPAPAIDAELGVIQLLLARERRRMAADVHDLIMQDLSLALANAHALSDHPTDRARASLVVGALEQALAGARDVLGGLAEHDTRPIAQAVEACARLAARNTPLRFHAERIPTATRPDRSTREALVHIAREAVTNAVKHARPSEIEVTLEYDGDWRLTVRDDGRGFGAAPSDPEVGGFGLASIRASANALGGAVHVGSGAGEGTTVEAVLP
ncbi:MAG TPA: ATP-binding protein [Solirubrobacteraceae bacterium]|jgi:signal transduction histidine kinase|nr:ATP-binding protein [Solirubrobacteraceae bacterium]